MTFAPPTLKAARQLLLDNLDMHPGSGSYPADLDPSEVGIVGDADHVGGGTSYHLGEDDLKSTAYSIRTARDKAGLSDAASAVDVGEFRVTTELGTFTHRSFAIWLVKQCQANAPDTRDVREVIYSPDGKTVLRYDRERGYASGAQPGEADDSHLFHDHISMYRDAEFRYSLYNLIHRWLVEIGVIDMGLKEDPDGKALIERVNTIFTDAPAVKFRVPGETRDRVETNGLHKHLVAIDAALASIAEKVGMDPVELAAIQEAARAGAEAGAKEALTAEGLAEDVAELVADQQADALRAAADAVDPPAA